MKHFSNIDTTRLSLVICLESINIDKKNKILTNTSKEFINSKTIFSYNDFKKKSQSSHTKSLFTMLKILTSNKEKDEKDKIVYILRSYSNKNRYYNSKLYSIVSKYIDRFAYKYIKYYKYNFINQDYKKNNNINSISLIYLYLLYKTLKTNKKFYIYKNLKLQIDELKTNFKF